MQTNGTDFGTQNGPFCSVAKYRDLYLPYQKRDQRLDPPAHELEDVHALLRRDRAVAGLHRRSRVRHPQPGPMLGQRHGCARAKENYGDEARVSGAGAWIRRKHFRLARQSRCVSEVRERIEVFGQGGGFVFCTIHNVQANTPTENLLALFEVVKQYR